MGKLLWSSVVGKVLYGEVLWRSVVDKYCREVL